MKYSLTNAKCIIWDQLDKEIKRLEDYLVQVEDARQLATSCLSDVLIVQESMRDKPLQAYNVINYLNSRTKSQLHFVGIQDRADLIAQARKYIIKDRLVKDMSTKANFLLCRVEYFKIIFKDMFSEGLPNFWNEQGICIPKSEYQLKLLEKMNDTSTIDQLTTNIKGHDIFEVIEKYFCLLHMTRQIIDGLPPLTYVFYSEQDAVSREMLAVSFPANPTWKRVSTFANKWNVPESSSTLDTTSQDSRA